MRRDMTTLQTKKVLIAVKAPPNPSEGYQETNCCAGIDLATGKWVRLYPIPFRLLDSEQQFPKYSIISVKCQRPLRDKRIESYKVDQDSIRILEHLDTKNEWARRREIILPVVSPSFCRILHDVSLNKSLGLFRPSNVQFVTKKLSLTKQAKLEATYRQYWLFDKQLKPLEQIPFAFYYDFRCGGCSDCPSHRLMIHDWELVAAYRRWRRKHTQHGLLLDKIKETWLHKLCAPTKDTHFIVGNMWRHPEQFMVLGVFYPPKSPPTLFNGKIEP